MCHIRLFKRRQRTAAIDLLIKGAASSRKANEQSLRVANDFGVAITQTDYEKRILKVSSECINNVW